MKQKFNIIESTCVPLPLENVDTDQIIPARFLKATTREGFGENLFRDWRYDKQGNKIDSFVLNDPTYGGQILVAGKNFGSGSSREHAAMEPRFLGVKVVLAKSFARIHETNLKKQGVLALTFANPADYDLITEDSLITVKASSLQPGKTVEVIVQRPGKEDVTLEAAHTYNEQQIAWFKAGSALACN